MRIFDLAQRPPQWLRAALAGLLLAFALNTVAHAAHEHEVAATSIAHGVACSYCSAFGGLADVPHQSWSPHVVEPLFVHVDPASCVVPVFRPRTDSRPRAPPLP